jgi:hypothetical protein
VYKKVIKSLAFGLGVAIVEIIYLRFALTGMDWVAQHKVVFKILGWATVFIFLLLGILAFVTARKQTIEKKVFYSTINYIAFY